MDVTPREPLSKRAQYIGVSVILLLVVGLCCLVLFMRPARKLVVKIKQAGVELWIDGELKGVSEKRNSEMTFSYPDGKEIELVAKCKYCEGGHPPVKIKFSKGQEKTLEVACKLPKRRSNEAGLEFVLIPAGTFSMGAMESDGKRIEAILSKYKLSPQGNLRSDFADEGPVHEVRISQDFYLGKYEVTQAQWRYVAERLPQVKRALNPSPAAFKGDRRPVEGVSWEDCEEFVLRLNGLGDGYAYALPTEAEWEYACRAGSRDDYAGKLETMGWYADNSGRAALDGYRVEAEAGGNLGKLWEQLRAQGCQTHEVGQAKENRWGLYDMHGNVWEWCADWYERGYYRASPPDDPPGPATGTERVVRGGCFVSNAAECRSAGRHKFRPEKGYAVVGLRVACRPVAEWRSAAPTTK